MKTISLKKVAVTAVASLGFGLLSVVPANADAVTSPTLFTSLGLAQVTASPVVGTAVEVNFGGVTTTANGDALAADADTIPVVGYLSTVPVGGNTPATASATGVGTDTEMFTAANVTEAANGGIYTITITTKATAAGATTTPTAATGAAKWSFTPQKAGAHVLTVFVDSNGNGIQGPDEMSASISVTVAAAPTYSNSLSQAYLVGGNGGTVATAATDLLPVVASKTGATTNAASITINAFNSSNAAMTAPGTVTVSVSGAGGLSSTFANTTDLPTAGQCSATTNARVVSFTADAVNNVIICADGTAGVGTFKIEVTNADGVTTTLATKTVTFVGSVAKIVATPVFTIGKAGGGTTGDATGNRNAATIVPAVIVKATDSAGNPVSGLTISALSSDTTVVNSAITINGDTAGATYSSGGAGFYNASFSTPTSAVSGAKATLTFRILDPADPLGVAYLTSVVNITIGGTTVATETLSFDKASYAPGEAMVVTVTAKDSSGNPVADGTASPAITFSKTVGGTSPAASTYTAGKKSTSATAPTVFAPAVPGAFTALATSGNAAGSTITATATVTDANAGLMTQIDALNAKIVALNALIAKIMKKLGVK